MHVNIFDLPVLEKGANDKNIRLWCKDLENGFDNLELWNGWIENTLENVKITKIKKGLVYPYNVFLFLMFILFILC